MKRLWITLMLCIPTILVGHLAEAKTIAYVVNSDTTYSYNTRDRQWIDFFKNSMGYTVKVISDDSAHAITNVNAYGGYFLSATMTSANLSNLSTTDSGVVICDQGMFDDFGVATGERSAATSIPNMQMTRYDSTHAITDHMFNIILFSQSGGVGYYCYTGIPQGAHILFVPTLRPNWNGEVGTPDSAFCYAIEAGDSLTSGVAAGRRVVALSHYGMLTNETDMGWCHPYELMGNICGWAWNDEDNQYNARFNCYSTDAATSPGPEVRQSWAEYPIAHEVFSNGRTGPDNGMGLMFLGVPYWWYKVQDGYEPDSVRFTYQIPYGGFGADSPPWIIDTLTIDSVVSTSVMFIDTTDFHQASIYDWRYQGQSESYGILVRSGVGADTTQVGDTCQLSAPIVNSVTNQSSRYANYTRCGIRIDTCAGTPVCLTNCSGIWNGTQGRQMRVLTADPYSGFSFWLKMYRILPSTPWTAPLASAGQGGNPEGSATRTWANRYYLKSGNSGQIAWSDTNLAPGVDHDTVALDSVLFNKDTFPPYGGVPVYFTIPGEWLNDPNWNWTALKTEDLTNGNDSADIEIIPNSFNSTRASFRPQKIEMWLSPAVPITIGFTDSTLAISLEENAFGIVYDTVLNTGDGVMAIDSIVENESWLTIVPTSGSTPLQMSHYVVSTGITGPLVDTATVLVYASTASNTPLSYTLILTVTVPPVETPAATAVKRTMRKR